MTRGELSRQHGENRPRVWIINHYSHLPEETGGLTRHHDFSVKLRELGWDVTIVSAGTRHPSGRLRLAPWKRSLINDNSGITNVWIPTTPYRGNGLDRMANMLLFGIRTMLSFRLRQLPRPDIVIGSTPHPLAAFAGWFIARRNRVPFVFEVRDLWPQALIEMGRLENGSLSARGMYKLEKFLAERADHIIALWQRFDRYFEEHSIKAKAVTWISNGFDENRFRGSKVKPGKARPFNFVYFGAHGNANDLEVAVEAMAILKDRQEGRHIRLELVGDGPLKQGLEKLAEKHQLENVSFKKPVAKSDVAELGTEADAFLLILKPLSIFRYGISPNKLFEYMALKRPVLFCCNASPNPVLDAESGIICKPGDAGALAEAMMDMASQNLPQLQQMARNGHTFAKQHFTVTILVQKYSRVLQKLIENRHESP